MSILAINPDEVEQLIRFLDKIWPGLATGAVLKWWSVAGILAIVFLGLYLVLRNYQKKQQTNDSKPGSRSDVLQERGRPDAAPGGLHAAPTPAEDHQDSLGPDRKPGVA